MTTSSRERCKFQNQFVNIRFLSFSKEKQDFRVKEKYADNFNIHAP
ncbi:MAG: hypothetical protein QXS69_02045 [Candidatus Aenigmatarchaeota archaeon]